MKQEVIDKFNAVTHASVEDYGKARDEGFQWTWFMNRAREKAVASGLLPQQGFFMFEARYVNSADKVLDGIIASMKSVERPNARVTGREPWNMPEVEQWKQMAMTTSAMMFDAGVVAALTFGYEEGFDPVVENAPAAIFGDVGFLGLRNKMLSFVQELGGDQAVDIVAEIGDCACSHLYADQHFTECVFKDKPEMRKAYFRGVCKAAYIAGAVFAKFVSGGQQVGR